MNTYELIVVGASWGGLHAVSEVLRGLPEELDAAVVVAQHRSPTAPSGGLEALLQDQTRRPVVEASDKEPIEPRHVYVAPPNYHLLVEPGFFALSTEGHVRYARPSIDVLFESAADAYRERVVGIVLTGANEDGAPGCAGSSRWAAWRSSRTRARRPCGGCPRRLSPPPLRTPSCPSPRWGSSSTASAALPRTARKG